MYLQDDFLGQSENEHPTNLRRTMLASTPEWAEGKTFTHPETKNKVQWSSLPADEQAKLRSKSEGGGEGDEKSSGGFLSKVQKVLSKVKAGVKKNKAKAVAFAKTQGKQTKEMMGTIKQIALAPPKPEPDMVQKAKDQATNIAKILFLAVNQALPIPGTMPATLWATSAVNKIFKTNFSWAPKTWAKAGHKISADEADEFLNSFVDKLIEAFDDPEVIEQVMAEYKKTQDKKDKTASFLPGRDEIGDDMHWGHTGAIDYILQGRSIEGAQNSALKNLTQAAREANALKLPVEAGTRVEFKYNLGSVLQYANLPDGMGTVITVRGASGDTTIHEGMVMVAWDEGFFMPTHPEHLQRVEDNQKRASSVRFSFVEFESVNEMFTQAKTSSSDLIHKATRDLWSFRQEGDNYVIERLFDGDGSPLKA